MVDWAQIEKYYDQGNTAGFALSLLESEKAYRKTLQDKNFPGQDWEEKTALSRKHLSAPQFFEQARNLVLQIIALNLPKNIGKQTTEQILRTYFTAITELETVPSSEIAKDRFLYQLAKVRKTFSKVLLWLIIIFVALVGIAFVLSNTTLGTEIVSQLISWTHWIIYKALPIILGSLTIIIIAIGFSLRSRKQKIAPVKDNKTNHLSEKTQREENF